MQLHYAACRRQCGWDLNFFILSCESYEDMQPLGNRFKARISLTFSKRNDVRSPLRLHEFQTSGSKHISSRRCAFAKRADGKAKDAEVRPWHLSSKKRQVDIERQIRYHEYTFIDVYVRRMPNVVLEKVDAVSSVCRL
jgi:hypothetical protein